MIRSRADVVMDDAVAAMRALPSDRERMLALMATAAEGDVRTRALKGGIVRVLWKVRGFTGGGGGGGDDRRDAPGGGKARRSRKGAGLSAEEIDRMGDAMGLPGGEARRSEPKRRGGRGAGAMGNGSPELETPRERNGVLNAESAEGAEKRGA